MHQPADLEMEVLQTLYEIRKDIIDSLGLRNSEDRSRLKIEITKVELMLRTEWFILSFFRHQGKMHNVLTFEVSVNPSRIADMTRIISKHIDAEMLTVGSHHFYDEETGELIFGEEAYYRKEEDFHKKAGRMQCAMCEKFGDINIIKPTGFCPLCKPFIKEIEWN